MLNSRIQIRLLSLPVLWMAAVQCFFGLTSLFIFNDRIATKFIVPAVILLILSGWIQFKFKGTSIDNVSFRDALAFAFFTWILAGVVGSLPIYFVTGVSFTDAVFESVSGLTTTGATILTGLDDMPKSFLLYRQFLQWMGGLGVVIFVVAILPMLNVGGMRLLKAETPGPMKNEKLAPRIANTSRYLWLVYSAITILCGVAYWFAGMSPYDALAHSFTTISTGGFSTHDASMGYFNSHLILGIANIFMILGSINFAIHFQVVYGRQVKGYWQDQETRYFMGFLIVFALSLSSYLYNSKVYGSGWEALSQATFHTVSFMTSTGFGATDLTAWPLATAAVLVIASYLGGCAGSTAGGNKMVRNVLTLKIIRQQLMKAIHPKAIVNVRYQGQTVSSDVLMAVMTFMVLVGLSTMLLTLLMMFTGLDFFTAFTAVSACLNVLGPGFGDVASNFIVVSDTGSWILVAAMILGRLEYFTVLAILLPKFWRY